MRSGGLVGRKQELGALARALRDVRSGGPAWAEVVGEPGIGKTRLLLEFGRLAEAEGSLVFTGRGTEMERDVPYGVIVDALDDYLGTLEGPRLEALCGPRLGLLAKIFPALPGAGAPDAGGFQDERYRSHRAVRALLERIAADRATVVLLDDLHWADPASTELLGHLLHHPPVAPLFLVLAWRSGHSPALGAVLASAPPQRPGLRIRLAPLNEEEMGSLLGPELSPGVRTAIYAESGGNPFYAEQLATSVAGALPRLGCSPDPITLTVRAEIDRLGGVARLVAQAASVVGEPFEASLVAACADLEEGVTLDTLDELAAAGLVQASESSLRFVFRHPIVRRAVYDSAAPGWRLSTHARAAQALRKAGAPLATQAHHVARSGRFGDLDAVQVLAEAAGDVRTQAPASAAEWLGAAIDLLPAGDETAAWRTDLLISRSAAWAVLGDLEQAQSALEAALDLAPEGTSQWVRLLAACVAGEHALGNWAQARDRLTRAESLPMAGPAEQAALCAEIALSKLFWLDYREAVAWGTRAVDLVAGVDTGHHALAAGLLAFLHAATEQIAPARTRADEAERAVRALGPSPTDSPADAFYYLGRTEYLLEDYRAAASYLERALLRTDGRASAWLVSTTVEMEMAKALAACGKLDQAIEAAENAVGSSRLKGYGWLLLLALAVQTTVLAGAGRLDEAVAAAEEAIGLDSHGAAEVILGIRRQLAMLRFDMGDVAGCLAELGATGPTGPDRCDETLVDPGTRCLLYSYLARAELASGHPEVALSWIEQAEASAARLGFLPASTGAALQARAAWLGAQDRPTEASTVALGAAAKFEIAGAPVLAARARTAAGRALSAAGCKERAVAELERARESLAACAAARWAEEAGQELRRLGVRVRKTARRGIAGAGVAALSGREAELAQLVVAGLTNREIASRLFISEKTVETHLSRVFAKLGVSSRAALAAAVAGAR